MKTLSLLTVSFVALSHVGFLIIEMFLWNTSVGLQVFGMTSEFARDTATLAANQGLYNGFLATGLLWAILAKRIDLKYFFLACVIVAGVFGACTSSITILYVQALPALVAIMFVYLAKNS